MPGSGTWGPGWLEGSISHIARPLIESIKSKTKLGGSKAFFSISLIRLVRGPVDRSQGTRPETIEQVQAAVNSYTWKISVSLTDYSQGTQPETLEQVQAMVNSYAWKVLMSPTDRLQDARPEILEQVQAVVDSYIQKVSVSLIDLSQDIQATINSYTWKLGIGRPH